jgi:hypothetical protein
MYQRMRQREICLTQLLVQANGIRTEARLAVGEEPRTGRVAGQRAIQVIRHAAHHAVRMVCGDYHRAAYARELRGSARQLERARDLAAARR